MKVLAFIVVATFLVLETSATMASVDERRLWDPQCRNETEFTGESTLSDDIGEERKAWCYSACYLEKAGLMKDGKLAEREKVVRDLAEEWSAGGGQPREGRTFRQLAEKCYDEANAKTEKCEIGGAVAKCVQQGLSPPADTVDDSSEETKESEE